MKNGVIYISFGGCMKEALHSVRTLKRVHPNLHVTLFTDKDPDCKLFDNMKIITVGSARIKQEHLWDSPYENTLYLDSDTGIVGPIIELFDLLQRFDIAATHDLMRKDGRKSVVYPDYAAIPDGFPEYGGGVLLFRKSGAVENFFEVWRKNYAVWYSLTNEVRDQPSFRVSLWQCSNLHIHTLPTEYNIRTKKYNNIIPRINHWHHMWRKQG